MFILTCTKPIVLQGFQTAVQAFTWNQSNPQEILFPQETYVLFEIFLICKISLKESKGEVLQNWCLCIAVIDFSYAKEFKFNELKQLH